MIYRFGEFEFDRNCRELREGGRMQPVEPQVFDLLGLLIDQRDRVVSKDEIVDEVWNGRIVSDAAISSRVMAARKAIGDDGRRQDLIKTVHGTGFRFVGTVDLGEDVPTEILTPRRGLNLRKTDPRASLLILPFRSLDTDPAAVMLADAIHEDLTSQLARMPDYQIIARPAALIQPYDAANPETIGQDLGVGYVVTGAVRPSGDIIRLNTRLVESATGRVLSALTFDRKRADLLDLQNTVIVEIANCLGAEVDLAEVRRLETDIERDPTAYFHFKQSQLLLDRSGWNRKSISRVIGHLENATLIDPDYAPAISMKALIKGFGAPYGLFEESFEEIKPEVIDLADEGIAKDPHRSTVLGWSGCAYCDVGEAEKGQPHLQRAIEIDPSNAQSRAALGWSHVLLSNFDEGLTHLDDAMAISPKLPGHAFWLCGSALALDGLGDADGRRAKLDEAMRLDPNFALPYIHLAFTSERDGDQAAADAYRARADELLGKTADLEAEVGHHPKAGIQFPGA